MKVSISEFLGFTDKEIYEIVRQDKREFLGKLNGISFSEKGYAGKQNTKVGSKILVKAS